MNVYTVITVIYAMMVMINGIMVVKKCSFHVNFVVFVSFYKSLASSSL